MTLSKSERTRLGDFDSPRAGGLETCGCNESIALRARLDLTTRAYAECCAHRRKLLRDVDLMKSRAPVITDDPFFYEVANAIDTELGWRTNEDEEGGMYADRIREVALELKQLCAERDYMLGMLQPDDIRVMRQELAKQWEAQHLGALPEGERTDPDGIF